MDGQTPTAEGAEVTETIRGAHPIHVDYALYPGDLLAAEVEDGTWMKEAPGLAIGGFILTAEQVASLRPVRFHRHHLSYCVERDEPTREQRLEAAEDRADQAAYDAARERS